MSEQPVLFPDAEALVADFLGDRPELASVHVGVTVPPDFDGTTPVVLISRIGGGFLEYGLLDVVMLRIETWGPSKPAAHDLARTVRALLALLSEARHPDGAVISDVTEERGPHWLPDGKRDGAPRYMTRVQLVIHVTANI